ncbi:trypsin-like peptidase domain-containing protein [Glutamicibacter sp. Je.9.36]|uniref:trypsin-like peptidase domain-containing protein n=1 Tax=Glutamicibacter sp. Je.9.36 TaxID=3142837 RepID=UPI003DA8D0F5
MIAPESVKSLHVETKRKPLGGGEDVKLGEGTAFVMEHAGNLFLITNMHVVTGRDPVTGNPSGSAALPTTLHTWHNTPNVGQWASVSYELYDQDGRAIWYEHPRNASWDMVAILIGPQNGLKYYPYQFTPPPRRQQLSPGSDLSIIGFPFGTASDGRFAIWSRATIASDLDVNYGNRPTFLVDSRSRPGQSGSPVVFKSDGMSADQSGNVFIGTGHPFTELLGIYSGRISAESDIGIVWKADAILEMLSNPIRSQRILDD